MFKSRNVWFYYSHFPEDLFSAVPCSPALVVHEECIGGFCLSAALWGMPAPAKSPVHDVLMMKLPEMARCCRRGPGFRDGAEVLPRGNRVHADWRKSLVVQGLKSSWWTQTWSWAGEKCTIQELQLLWNAGWTIPHDPGPKMSEGWDEEHLCCYLRPWRRAPAPCLSWLASLALDQRG